MFADIFNVLLFKKKLITPDRLRPLSVETIYKAADGYLGMQERDVIKEYRGSRFLVAALGIENQATIDKDINITDSGGTGRICAGSGGERGKGKGGGDQECF